MQKSIFSFSLSLGLTVLSLNGVASAQQTTVRTGPNSNSQTTTRTIN